VVDLLFEFFLLGVGQSEKLHFSIKLFPVLFLLLFLLNHSGISLLDEVLGGLNLLFGSFRQNDLLALVGHFKYKVKYL